MIREWLRKLSRDAALKELKQVKSDYEAVVDELGVARRDLRRMTEELEGLKLKKKIEDEDIRHMTKIKLEQNEIEFQKKVIAVEKQKDMEVTALKQQYADKMQARLESEVKNIKEMYGQILHRLPDVNVRLKGDV